MLVPMKFNPGLEKVGDPTLGTLLTLIPLSLGLNFCMPLFRDHRLSSKKVDTCRNVLQRLLRGIMYC